jgi:hypothetical protein
MTVELFTNLTKIAFSGLDAHSDSGYFHPVTVTRNLFRVSAWGTISSGATALASFIFSKTLTQEGIWKTIAPHVFDASLISCGTFAAFASYSVYIAVTEKSDYTDETAKALNGRVSSLAKKAAMVGYLGTIAAWVSTKPVEKHVYSFVGLGIAGSILWIAHIWQNQQLTITNDKKGI